MLIPYLVVAALSLVWGAVLLRWGGLLAGCLAVVILACCFGFDFLSFRAGPLPMTSDRVAVMFLSLVYLAARIQGWIQSPRIDRVDVLFGLFLLILSVNTLTHDWSFRGAQPLANLLFLYGLPAAVYWIARESQVSEGRIRMVYAFLGMFGIYLAVTAVAETKQLHSLIFPRYIVTSANHEWLGRGRGPFLNPATNGIYMAAGLFAWAMLWPRVSRFGKGLVLAAMGVVLVGIYCTLTRSCWMGAAAGLGVIAFATVPRGWRLTFLVGCLLVSSLGYVLTGESFSSFKRDKNVSEYHMAQSAKLRPMLATVAFKIVWDHPLFGCGFGQYKKVDGEYVYDRSANMSLEVAKRYVQHNVFLSLMAETGLVGLGLYVAVLVGWLNRAKCLWMDQQLPISLRRYGVLFGAFFASWLVNGLFHDTSLMMNANLLAFLLAGLSQGIYARSKTDAPEWKDTQSPEFVRSGWNDAWSARPTEILPSCSVIAGEST